MKKTCFLFPVLFCLGTVMCADQGVPYWVSKLPAEKDNLYFLGVKTGAASLEEGKNEAFRDGLSRIVEYVGVELKSEFHELRTQNFASVFSSLDAKASGKIEDACMKEIYTEKNEEKDGVEQRFNVFVLLSYPVRKMEEERARIKEKNRIDTEKVRRYYELAGTQARAGGVTDAFQNLSIAFSILKETTGNAVLEKEMRSFVSDCLGRIKFIPFPHDPSGRTKTGLERALKVKIVYVMQEKEMPLENVPVRFYFTEGSGDLESPASTDREGIAESRVKTIYEIRKDNMVRACF
ncbi:MAG TPA: hypothetical protein VJC03_02605, partial [bacterium]|nr:hypothetical protein [bacterium]